MRSRVTKKGQVTVPVELRKQLHLEPGKSVRFEKFERGILMEPVRDLADSAGALSKFADSDEVLKDLLESRKKPFR